MKFINFNFDFFSDESGQGMVEYALILGLIAIAVLLALGGMGDTLKSMYFDEVTDGLNEIND